MAYSERAKHLKEAAGELFPDDKAARRAYLRMSATERAIGKLRIDGSKVGAACRLWVEHGRVADLPDAVRRDWQSAQNAIRTSRDAR